MRYVGQAYSLTVGSSLGDDPLLLDSLERSFVEQHRHTYGYVLEEVPTEIVAVRVSASVQTEPARWELDEREPQFEERRVADLGHGPSEVPVLDRSGLPSDSAVVGPAIIEQEDSTTVVGEGWNARGGRRRLFVAEQERAVSLDPVTQEIFTNALSAVAEEMAVVEYRSSFSPIIREMLDFNCALFDPQGRMVAHSEQIPAQLGLMQFALDAALTRRGPLGPGDAVLTNHPYMGGTHTNDLQVFVPIYEGATLVGYAGSIAHHIDIGGTYPGTESALTTELFHEGMLFPAIKLVSGGVPNKEIYEMIDANVRDPQATIGDLGAQLAACKRGVERVGELCARFGLETVIESMDLLLSQTAAQDRRHCSASGHRGRSASRAASTTAASRERHRRRSHSASPPWTATSSSTSRVRRHRCRAG